MAESERLMMGKVCRRLAEVVEVEVDSVGVGSEVGSRVAVDSLQGFRYWCYVSVWESSRMRRYISAPNPWILA